MWQSFHPSNVLAMWVFFLLATLSRAPPPNPSGEPRAKGQVVNIMAGQKGLQFVPPTVNAVLNEQITIWFFAKNHSITETSLEDPCTALPGKSSFDSGFISVSMNATEYPTQILTVNTLKPIYFACVQKMHCELGMVGGINLPLSGPGSLEDFKSRAKATLAKAGKKADAAAHAGGKSGANSPPGEAGANTAAKPPA